MRGAWEASGAKGEDAHASAFAHAGASANVRASAPAPEAALGLSSFLTRYRDFSAKISR